MPRLSLSPQFWKEVYYVFTRRPLTEILFGKKTAPTMDEKSVIAWIKANPVECKNRGGRTGKFAKISLPHQGWGMAYLIPNVTGNKEKQSLLVFGEDFAVVPGPDLWVYLSPNDDVMKNNFGEFMNLGLLKGTKGVQAYVIDKPLPELAKYKTAVIHCKQFEALFTYAHLA